MARKVSGTDFVNVSLTEIVREERTLRYMYEVGRGEGELGRNSKSCWVSRSSKRMPPAMVRAGLRQGG
jgi:hypothetical protein